MAGFQGLRVLLVGPVPPPDGGMANQTAQLARLLRAEGAVVELVAVNAPYRPAWAGRIRGVRAFARLVPFLARLWSAAGRADVVHIMANSDWSWHLAAAPAVWIASRRRVPSVVNYRGGGADAFFRREIASIRPTLARCSSIVVPSAFLLRVFEQYGFQAVIVPNVVDLERFAPADPPRAPSETLRAPHLVVTRHLEAIYDIGTALRALRLVRERFPAATISIAGSGAERAPLEALAESLAIREAVTFTGRLENDRMAALYRGADLVLNTSLVDNMPISILEALASGVPVVSTNVGGIPDLVRDGITATLVEPDDPAAMAAAAIDLLASADLRADRVRAGLEHVRQFTWDEVRTKLSSEYARAADVESKRAGSVPRRR